MVPRKGLDKQIHLSDMIVAICRAQDKIVAPKSGENGKTHKPIPNCITHRFIAARRSVMEGILAARYDGQENRIQTFL
jgi:hypothetical protein